MINNLSVLTVNNKNCQDINQSEFGAKIKVFRVVVNVFDKTLVCKISDVYRIREHRFFPFCFTK